MKKMWTHLAIVAAVGLMVNTPSAQSLADLAKREEARRKAIKAPAKVITNDDLPHVPPPPSPVTSDTPSSEATTPASGTTPSADGSTSPQTAQTSAAPGSASAQTGQPAAAAADAAKATAGGPVKDEAYWRQRMKTAHDTLARLQTFQEALQSRVNALSTDFVNRDDPAQRAVISTDRQKALAELDRVKHEIQETQTAIADTQEEARRANVPAGWLR